MYIPPEQYYVCTSAYGVTLEWEPSKSLAEVAFRKAGKGARLEVFKNGVRKILKIKKTDH